MTSQFESTNTNQLNNQDQNSPPHEEQEPTEAQFLSTPPQSNHKKKNLQLSSSKFFGRTLTSPLFSTPPPPAFESTDVTHSCVATESITGYYGVTIIEHLDLNNFKTKPCLVNTQHNHKHCPFFHNAKDRKRPGTYYSADLCEFSDKEILMCPNSDACSKAHNRVE